MTVPKSAAVLLDFIGQVETGRSGIDAYNTVYGHKEAKLPKPLTQFTLDELLTAQKTWGKNWGSSAAGKYQIIRATLAGLVKDLGLRGDKHFTPQLQDELGLALLKRRGYARFVAGQTTITAFGNELAKEWASMPVLSDMQGHKRQVQVGQSYYSGDGLNKALVKPEAFREVLGKAMVADVPTVAPKPAPKRAEPPTSKALFISGWTIFWVVVAAALLIAAFTIKF